MVLEQMPPSPLVPWRAMPSAGGALRGSRGGDSSAESWVGGEDDDDVVWDGGGFSAAATGNSGKGNLFTNLTESVGRGSEDVSESDSGSSDSGVGLPTGPAATMSVSSPRRRHARAPGTTHAA